MYSIYDSLDIMKIHILNPTKARLFESSFFWGRGQFDPPFIFQEELI